MREPTQFRGVDMDVGSPSVGIELASPAMGVAADRVAASDAALMSRVQSGDQEAFGDLIERHKDGLVNYLTKMTRDRDKAEELAQDAFLRLYQKSSYYKEQGHLLPYLMRITTNLLRSEQRRAARWRLLGREATEVVEEALAELPLRYRAPLVLREIEGLSYREISVALECREGTVKSRISRGRAELRTLLEPYWKGHTGETA
ncbi:MAG: sigma factor-like helix-turn-helix DNA-binding protein [Acidobacteriota bacterium]|nr:sigma factor-like helix-turn-helix DNA-binding protein [Acidobacteriota bacterium]